MPRMIIAKDLLDSLAGQPKSVMQQFKTMIDLFEADPNHPSLHREHYQVQADRRAQTVRVNQGLRAIILKSEASQDFICVDVLSHDKADYWMANTVASVNTVTGALELCDVTRVARAADAIADQSAKPVDLFHGARDRDFVHLGVSEQFIPLLRMASTRRHLDTLVALLPDLQGDAVELLADGVPVDEAQGIILDLIDSTAPIASDPDDLVTAAANPASSTRFHVVSDDAELDDILARPLAQWRVFLHPSQRKLVDKTFQGAVRVSGGPGTGKTVVALHRARSLARRYPEDRILFTTFTATLAADLVTQLRTLAGPETDGRVDIINIDRFALRLLKETTPKTAVTPVSEADLATLFADACNETGIAFAPSFIRQEWEQIVLAAPVDSRDDYFKIARPGRGVRLNRKQRAEVWEVIELITARLSKKGKRTFLQIASDAASAVRASGHTRYEHVIVDEAQDLHPAHWRLIRALAPTGPDDLFLVGDAQQRIYDRKVVLSRYGINIRGRSSVLRLNYRSTAEIVRWSVALLAGSNADDLDDGGNDPRAYRSVLQGSAPVVTGYASTNAEVEAMVAEVQSLVGSGAKHDEVIVAARRNDTAEVLRSRLDGAGIPAVTLTESSGDPDAVHVATFHRLKGLEYRHVFLVDVSDGVLPMSSVLTSAADDPQQHEEDLARERSLLFVAATRARDSLHVSYHGKPSPFLPPVQGAVASI